MPKQAFIGAMAVLALASAGLLSSQGREYARTFVHALGFHRPAPPAEIGKALPVLNVVDTNGRETELKAPARGTVVYNVFASWCPPCQAELPGIRLEAAKLARRGIPVVGIDQGEAPSRVATFARVHDLRFHIVVDQSSASETLLGARMIPETLIVHNGVLASMLVGPITPQQLSQAVANV